MNPLTLPSRLASVIAGSILVFAAACFGQTLPLAAQPEELDVRTFLVQRIENESKGRILLKSLQTKAGPLEEAKSNFCAVYFFAEVWFVEPCMWDVRADGRPLSFTTIDLPGGQSGNTNNQDMLIVARRGQGFVFSGDIAFERKSSQWVAKEIRIRFYPKQNERQDFARVSCSNNLKQIANGLRAWAIAHQASFAFNLSTNAGGTKEMCVIADGGFDNNPAIHFQAMRGKQLDPRILVCPADLKKPAAGLASLQTTNVSYQLRTGSSVTLTNSKEILCECPIHGIAISCDGRLNYLKQKGY